MFNKNNGSDEHEILQNQFTAYVKKAVHNRRIRYLLEQSRKNQWETPYVEIEYMLFHGEDRMENVIDFEVIHQALRLIREKERYIVLARVIEEKSFDEIADELGMTYKAVTSLYYRVMKKLRTYMEGGGDNDIL